MIFHPLWRWAWAPTGLDGDRDGMTDRYETAHGLDPLLMADRLSDDDLDGLSAIEEYRQGTHPGMADSDEDGVTRYCRELPLLSITFVWWSLVILAISPNASNSASSFSKD